jgi:hypothetical protein
VRACKPTESERAPKSAISDAGGSIWSTFCPTSSSRPSQCDLGELTLAAVRIHGHGAGSDTPLDEALWTPAEWRDAKCVWWGNHGTEAEALQALGLRE